MSSVILAYTQTHDKQLLVFFEMTLQYNIDSISTCRVAFNKNSTFFLTNQDIFYPFYIANNSLKINTTNAKVYLERENSTHFFFELHLNKYNFNKMEKEKK